MNLHQSFTSSYDMAAAYQNEGNTQQARYWTKQGDASYRSYIREGCTNSPPFARA